MNQRFVLIWAALATLIAVGMTGYVVGKNVEARGAQSREVRPATDMPYSTAPGGAAEPAPTFALPAAFANSPREWRTADTDDLTGYVALFNPQAREIIVEQCRHAGYPVDAAGRTGQPMEQELSLIHISEPTRPY